jgi:hypothetical protein
MGHIWRDDEYYNQQNSAPAKNDISELYMSDTQSDSGAKPNSSVAIQNYDIHREQELSNFMPYFRENYNLFYGTQHFYIFLRMFYTLYERLIKAKNLIYAKVEEDKQSEE